MSTSNPYVANFQETEKQLKELIAQREGLDKQIAKLTQLAVSLAALVEDEAPELAQSEFMQSVMMADIGFTDAVRKVLRERDKYMTPVEVRDALEGSGFPLSDYTSPLASIHKILGRLEDSGEAKPSVSVTTGKTGYRWNWQTFVKDKRIGKKSKK